MITISTQTVYHDQYLNIHCILYFIEKVALLKETQEVLSLLNDFSCKNRHVCVKMTQNGPTVGLNRDFTSVTNLTFDLTKSLFGQLFGLLSALMPPEHAYFESKKSLKSDWTP